ncbi:putative mitochondrial carrier domain superfamily [Helianthus annuus]|nr:putative mitochondrial carrier domain superfamily [Helianthus annuus]
MAVDFCDLMNLLYVADRVLLLLLLQNGTIQGLKYIWRTEGFKGMFKGNGTKLSQTLLSILLYIALICFLVMR